MTRQGSFIAESVPLLMLNSMNRGTPSRTITSHPIDQSSCPSALCMGIIRSIARVSPLSTSRSRALMMPVRGSTTDDLFLGPTNGSYLQPIKPFSPSAATRRDRSIRDRRHAERTHFPVMQ